MSVAESHATQYQQHYDVTSDVLICNTYIQLQKNLWFKYLFVLQVWPTTSGCLLVVINLSNNHT